VSAPRTEAAEALETLRKLTALRNSTIPDILEAALKERDERLRIETQAHIDYAAEAAAQKNRADANAAALKERDEREKHLREAWKANVDDLAWQYGEVVKERDERIAALMQSYESAASEADRLEARAVRAKAEVERLREALRRFFSEYDGKVGEYAPTDDTEAFMRDAFANDESGEASFDSLSKTDRTSDRADG
jgi:hypothetical protein